MQLSLLPLLLCLPSLSVASDAAGGAVRAPNAPVQVSDQALEEARKQAVYRKAVATAVFATLPTEEQWVVCAMAAGGAWVAGEEDPANQAVLEEVIATAAHHVGGGDKTLARLITLSRMHISHVMHGKYTHRPHTPLRELSAIAVLKFLPTEDIAHHFAQHPLTRTSKYAIYEGGAECLIREAVTNAREEAVTDAGPRTTSSAPRPMRAAASYDQRRARAADPPTPATAAAAGGGAAWGAGLSRGGLTKRQDALARQHGFGVGDVVRTRNGKTFVVKQWRTKVEPPQLLVHDLEISWDAKKDRHLYKASALKPAPRDAKPCAIQHCEHSAVRECVRCRKRFCAPCVTNVTKSKFTQGCPLCRFPQADAKAEAAPDRDERAEE